MRHRLVLAVVTIVFAAQLSAGPRNGTRYLVLEVDANDLVSMVASRHVSTAADLSADDDGSVDRTASQRDVVEAELIGVDGAVIQRQVAPLDRYLRAEYRSSADGTIEGRWIERDRTPFVLRLPMDDAAFVDVTVARSGRRQRFAVRDLDRQARSRSEASDLAAAATLKPVGQTSNPANRVDLVILGDGYTADQAVKFYEDVDRIAGAFLGIEPYASYGNYVNIVTLFVPSRQSGADHPACPDAPNDPLKGQMVDTAFDATFCTSQMQRLLTVNTGKAYAAAAAIPDWDKLIVIVNDTTYGGAGGAVSVASTHTSAVEIVQHEYGHSFTRLADEYDTPYPAYGTCSDAGAVHGCEANVTDVTARDAIKWGAWILPSTPVPTPASDTQSIGLFEGARYKSTGMYRPKSDCLMNHLGAAFCAVCAQEYVLRLYGGWNGNPSRGIDLIEPGTEQPAGSRVAMLKGEPKTFTASLLQPLRASLEVKWLVNGAEVSEAKGAESFTFVPPSSGTYDIELRASDPTPLVRASGVNLVSKSRKWTVDVSTRPTGPKRRSTGS